MIIPTHNINSTSAHLFHTGLDINKIKVLGSDKEKIHYGCDLIHYLEPNLRKLIYICVNKVM